MPLTSQGKRTLEDFTRRYGPKKGKNIFYAMINSGKLKKMEVKEERGNLSANALSIVGKVIHNYKTLFWNKKSWK